MRDRNDFVLLVIPYNYNIISISLIVCGIKNNCEFCKFRVEWEYIA